MSAGSSLLGGFYRLPPGKHQVEITRDLQLPSKDGTILCTDLFRPRTKGMHPTLMMRVPYGRMGFDMVAEAYAERGYNTVLQACRGTDGSQGTFDPLTYEREDGLSLVEWIKEQDWFDGRLGTSGPSYLGYAQWAICDAEEIDAMSIKVSSAEFESIVFPGGAFALQLWLSWVQTVEGLRGAPLEMGFNMLTGEIERRSARAANKLPLSDGDIEATGHQVPFWRRWFAESIDNGEFWEALDHTKRITPKSPPTNFVSGWYDFMLDQLLRDYHAMVGMGHTPHLTIGTWHHIDNDLQGESIRQTLNWMDAYLLNNRSGLRAKPVRLHISGNVGWRDFDRFPSGKMETLYLESNGKLETAAPAEQGISAYTYNPADPTPSIGGAMFAFTGAGPVDNRKLEARKDVLTFSSEALKEPKTVIGHAEVILNVRSDCEYTDIFARLCDVSPSGKSTNISDRLERLKPGRCEPDGDGVMQLALKLHACGHRFQKGHRIRLQVSSGAHPRFARNLGTDEPIGTATTLRKQNQEVFSGGAYPSAIAIPVVEL